MPTREVRNILISISYCEWGYVSFLTFKDHFNIFAICLCLLPTFYKVFFSLIFRVLYKLGIILFYLSYMLQTHYFFFLHLTLTCHTNIFYLIGKCINCFYWIWILRHNYSRNLWLHQDYTGIYPCFLLVFYCFIILHLHLLFIWN